MFFIVLLLVGGGVLLYIILAQSENNTAVPLKVNDQAIRQIDRLVRVFLRDQDMINAVILRSGTYRLIPETSVNVIFVADTTLQKISIQIWTPDEASEAILTITTPYQEDPVIGSISKEPKAIEITDDMYGVWKLDLYNPGAQETDINIMIIGFHRWDRNYNVRLYVDTERSNSDETILTLNLEDTIKYSGYNVSATLRLPNMSIIPITFQDDGVIHDLAAGDGDYTCAISGAFMIQKGEYSVNVRIDNDKGEMRRIEQRNIRIGGHQYQKISENITREFYIFITRH